MALGTDYLIRYLADIKGAVQGAKQIEQINANVAKNIQAKYGEVTKIIGDIAPSSKISPITSGQFAGLNQEILKTGQIVQTVNGSFLELSKTQTIVGGQIRNTAVNVKDVTSQFVKTNLEVAKANKIFTNFADNVKQLAGRALLTIPIWIALRGAIMGVFSGISGGFASFLELDKALNKARVAAGGTVEEIKKEIATLKPAIEKLAEDSGQSIADLGEAFFSFRASGLDFSTSLAGMNVSNKIARTQMGDLKKVAESLAKVMLLMGDSFESGGTSIDKMNTFAALSYELNTRNAFTIDQLTDSMLAFAPSAKVAGLSAEETLKLMATVNSAGIQASSAGRTLSTGLSKFISNFRQLTPLLNITVDPKKGTYAALLQTLEALKKLNAEGTLSPEFTNAVDTLFGGEKGGKTIKALVAVYDLLQANNRLTGDINKLNTAFNEVNNSAQVQVERFGKLRDAAFRAFVTGVIGGDDFAKSVEKFNDGLQKSIELIKDIGEAIPNVRFTPPGAVIGIFTDVEKSKKQMAELVDKFNQEIQRGLSGQLTVPELVVVLQKLETKTAKNVIAPGTITQLKTALTEQLNKQEIELKNIKVITPTVEDKFLQVGSDEEKIAKARIDYLLNQLKLQEASNVEIELAKQLYTEQFGIIQSLPEKEQERLNLQKAINEESKKLNDIQKDGLIKNQLSFLSLQGASEVQIIRQRIELEKMYRVNQSQGDLLKNELELSKAITEEKIKLSKTQRTGLIDSQIEELKLQGATEVQLVKQRIALEKMYGVKQTQLDLLNNELEVNKAITREKYNQNKVSSDSVKLFQIAQRFGTQVAVRASDFLSGKLPVTAYEPGRRESDILPILQEFFSTELEQRRAFDFFFNGKGQGIPIPERDAIRDFVPKRIEDFKLPDIKTDIGQINVEIKKVFKDEDTAKQILDSMLEAIRNNPAIEAAINEKIDSF